MEKLKKFCNAYKEEKEIIEILRDAQTITFKLSCDHRFIEAEFFDKIGFSDELKVKHFDPLHKLLSRLKTKTSRETKRPARDNIIIDRNRQKVIHEVWEQNENGEWELVHDEEKPLSEKEKS